MIASLIVALVVICAVVYFARHIYGLFKGTSSCCGGSGSSESKTCSGGCAGCAAEETEKRLGIRYKKTE